METEVGLKYILMILKIFQMFLRILKILIILINLKMCYFGLSVRLKICLLQTLYFLQPHLTTSFTEALPFYVSSVDTPKPSIYMSNIKTCQVIRLIKHILARHVVYSSIFTNLMIHTEFHRYKRLVVTNDVIINDFYCIIKRWM